MFPFTLALLFIIRLRFPSNKSLFQVIRERYGAATVKAVRQWESASRRSEKIALDVDFLVRCLTHGIVPKFLKIKLYRKSLTRTDVYRDFQRQLLEKEIWQKRRLQKHQKTIMLRLSLDVKKKLSWIDYNHVSNFVSNSVCKLNKNVTSIHRNKFTSLGGSYDPTFIDPNKCLFNVSNYTLSSRETFLLSLGLDFCLPVFHYPKKSILLSAELLLNRLKELPCLSSTTFDEVVSKTKDLLLQLPKLVYKNHTFIKKDDIATLKKLGKNSNLKICKPDKGNGVVIMNTTDYVEKMSNILNDNTKFRKCKDHEGIYNHNLKMEDKINYFLRKIKKQDVINESEYKYRMSMVHLPRYFMGCPRSTKQICLYDLSWLLSVILRTGWQNSFFLL